MLIDAKRFYSAIWKAEVQSLVIERRVALVNDCVVVRTQQHQIVQSILTSAGAIDDVMRLSRLDRIESWGIETAQLASTAIDFN